MDEWRNCELGDVVTLKRGYDLPHRDRRAGAIPVVSSSGITDFHADAKVQGPGVVTGRYGTLGEVFYIEGAFWPLNTSLYVRDFRGNDPRFISYLLRSLNFETQNAAGAVPGVNRNHLHTLNVRVPTPQLQRRIARTLAAYDDLIDNNQRRIRILEEMARALYREWFVQFRFPGHQDVRRVDSPIGSIPRGWAFTTLGDHLAVLETGRRPRGGVADVMGGVPSIGAENIDGIGRHKFGSEKFVPREFFDQMRSGVVRDRDVAIYKDGAYIGKSSYFRDGFPHAECCVNEHVFLLRTKGDRLTQNALYLWLQEPDTVHALRATNANAAQPGLNQKSVLGIQRLVPDAALATRFDRTVEPFLAQIVNLAKTCENLRRTRDLLLPRLLSGRITLAAAEAAA